MKFWCNTALSMGANRVSVLAVQLLDIAPLTPCLTLKIRVLEKVCNFESTRLAEHKNIQVSFC